MAEILTSDACETMAQVRAGVDDVDRRLVALLAERFGYMRAAARIKPDRGLVRDEARKTQVIDNVVAEAGALSVPTEIVADLWERLVEGSIAYEMATFDRLRAGAAD
jgi:isochorismate pyruvate lyase